MLHRVCIVTLLALAPLPAMAFCVINETKQPLDVQAGGGPMPIWYQPGVKPGQTVCHIPRRRDVGITVEVKQGAGALKCRLSVPAQDATIVVGESCRVRLG